MTLFIRSIDGREVSLTCATWEINESGHFVAFNDGHDTIRLITNWTDIRVVGE